MTLTEQEQQTMKDAAKIFKKITDTCHKGAFLHFDDSDEDVHYKYSQLFYAYIITNNLGNTGELKED